MKFCKKIFSFLLLFLFVSFSYHVMAYENITSDENIDKKSVVFEGALYSFREDVEEVEEISAEFEYSQIKFFLEEPESFQDIEFDRPSIGDDFYESQALLKETREKIKNFIYEYNYGIASDLQDVLNLDNMIIGEYSFTIDCIIETDEINESLISNLEYVLNCDNVIEEIYISEILVTENELTNMFPRINVDSMISSGLYTGRNVNVGIVESGAVPRISSFTSDYSGRNITIKSGSSGVHDHADHVTMIAVGNNGIARGSNIFLSNSTGGAEEYLNWMIKNNVNIVNTSFGYKDEAASGTYTSEAKRIDQMVRNSFITMVGSAGNSNTSPTLRVTGPKTAYNYITVGNSGTTTTTRVAGSCYVEQSGYGASKPNLMAPGTVTTNAYGGVSKSGTSFASPQVVGCLALLMEEFPFLIAYPELCLSVVTSSASPMSSTYNTLSGNNYYDQSGLHNEIGAGLLNYEKMREAMNNYVSITRARNSLIEDLDDTGETLEFTASKNQRVRASLAWLANGSDENNFTNYDLYLQRKQSDGSYITLMYINGDENNVEFLDYTFGNDGTYRLLIKQKEVNVKKDLLALSYVLIDGTIGGSKSGGNIEHTCANYIETGSNPEYHIDKCDCGYYSYELHSKVLNNGILKCQECEWFEINNSYTLSNYSSTINKNFLVSNETMDFELYELNSMYDKNYEFYISSTESLVVRLYDDELNSIEILDLDENQNIFHFIYRMNDSTKYYLSVGYENNNSVGTINTKIVSRTTAYIGVGDNDVLLNTHNNISEYVYTNNQGPGIYRFKLNGTTIDETSITYPSNSLVLYTDYTRSIEANKLYFDEDEILVYLPSNGAYYLNINLNEASYSSLSINISSIERNTIDYINGLTSIRFNIIFENENSLCYYEEVTIKQKSEIQLDIMTSGTITDSIPVYVYSRIFNEETNKYDLVETFIGEITPIDRVPVYTLVLDAGTYYFGYKNNIDNTNINFGIRRMVDYDMNMEGILVADPNETGFELGTEVLINEGECSKYYITEGFTRNIYLLAEDKFSIPISRLDYDWYSSNEAVATVTNYGTVLAMPVTENTSVTIYAVLKADPKIVYYRTFTVLNDEEENLEEITLNMSYSYSDSNGTYQLELTNINCPYPMIQYYSWNIRNESEETVTMNQWGEISSTGICTVQIEGIYNLNTRVRLYITLTIE